MEVQPPGVEVDEGGRPIPHTGLIRDYGEYLDTDGIREGAVSPDYPATTPGRTSVITKDGIIYIDVEHLYGYASALRHDHFDPAPAPAKSAPSAPPRYLAAQMRFAVDVETNRLLGVQIVSSEALDKDGGTIILAGEPLDNQARYGLEFELIFAGGHAKNHQARGVAIVRARGFVRWASWGSEFGGWSALGDDPRKTIEPAKTVPDGRGSPLAPRDGVATRWPIASVGMEYPDSWQAVVLDLPPEALHALDRRAEKGPDSSSVLSVIARGYYLPPDSKNARLDWGP